MKIEILENAGIDCEKSLKRFLGRSAIYEKALKKFTADTCFKRIRAAYADGDKEGFFAAVHEFKGMCGNLGLDSLYLCSDDLVRLLRRGEYSQGELENCYTALSTEYEKILTAVLSALEDAQ